MMSRPEQALVLKNFWPRQNKVALLADQRGRLDGWIMPEVQCVRLRPGMLIRANLHNYKNGFDYRIQDLDMLSLPALKLWPLTFLHHILELIYYSLPGGLINLELFQICLYLFHSSRPINNSWNQHLVLCKILFVLGFYPEGSESRFSDLLRLLLLPIDMMLNQKIDLDDQNDAARWLHVSLWHHPQVNLFKAMLFKIES